MLPQPLRIHAAVAEAEDSNARDLRRDQSGNRKTEVYAAFYVSVRARRGSRALPDIFLRARGGSCKREKLFPHYQATADFQVCGSGTRPPRRSPGSSSLGREKERGSLFCCSVFARARASSSSSSSSGCSSLSFSLPFFLLFFFALFLLSLRRSLSGHFEITTLVDTRLITGAESEPANDSPLGSAGLSASGMNSSSADRASFGIYCPSWGITKAEKRKSKIRIYYRSLLNVT